MSISIKSHSYHYPLKDVGYLPGIYLCGADSSYLGHRCYMNPTSGRVIRFNGSRVPTQLEKVPLKATPTFVDDVSLKGYLIGRSSHFVVDDKTIKQKGACPQISRKFSKRFGIGYSISVP